MAELADALDSGSSGHCARAGSSPVIRRNVENHRQIVGGFLFFKNNSSEIIQPQTFHWSEVFLCKKEDEGKPGKVLAFHRKVL